MSHVGRYLPAGFVAAGAAVATSHGLYEVATASGVGWIAFTYPLITDGLAAVAYEATTKLSGREARYAWTVVVVAACLSGLAQAYYLVAGPGLPAPPLLRFGIGAWPAIAAAVVAHLLYLRWRADHPLNIVSPPTDDDVPVEGPDLAALAATAPDLAADHDGRGDQLPPLPLRASSELATSEHDASTRSSSRPQSTSLVLLPSPSPEVGDVVDSSAEVQVEGPSDPRVAELVERLARGEDLDGEAVGQQHGVSPRQGRRLIAQARAHIEGTGTEEGTA